MFKYGVFSPLQIYGRFVVKERELYKVASAFRNAIIEAKKSDEFNFRDRMHRFPVGCCDDSCDLLGFYLWEKYKIHTNERSGYYDVEMSNHVWLITDDKIIIDITGDQFGDKWESVYVGLEIGNYEKFTRVVTQKNFDIRELPRLWNDYNIILKYLNDITATII